MARILELVGGPPASGKSTYVRREYGGLKSNNFAHLDFDAMVVQEVRRSYGSANEAETRSHVEMVYGRDRAATIYGSADRVTVDWPFCVSTRAEEYILLGRNAERRIECNFFTAHATEAWKRSLTRHVAGEYNAFTVFLNKDGDIGEALKPSFRMFLEAHQGMPASVERIFPQADTAFLWDNNARDALPILIAKCKKGEEIEVVDAKRWDRFQYKREINPSADFEIQNTAIEHHEGKERKLFDVKFANLIINGRERAEYAHGRF